LTAFIYTNQLLTHNQTRTEAFRSGIEKAHFRAHGTEAYGTPRWGEAILFASVFWIEEGRLQPLAVGRPAARNPWSFDFPEARFWTASKGLKQRREMIHPP
jgi:hypothetical protein